ncbi:MAG: SDR family oxidoreductase [Pseudomonadota bacterium]
MPLKVLFIGGTGQISLTCVQAAVAKGHNVTVFNRGQSNVALPEGVTQLTGDFSDAEAYRAAARAGWDAVCQFIAFTPQDIQRDVEIFTGQTDQYIFISTASAYQKPIRACPITEDVPLENPFWEYSRLKAAAESVLTAQPDLPWTIVRPSHTLRSRLPTALGEHDLAAERLLANRPVIVPGDGTSLWTLTRCEDFAQPFVGLFGNLGAIRQAFHLTSDTAFTWDAIYQALAEALGTKADIVHVPTDTLIRFRPDWEGPLLGDKANTAVFDNSKIKSVVGNFECADTLGAVLAEPMRNFNARTKDRTAGSDELGNLLDAIAAAQRSINAP